MPKNSKKTINNSYFLYFFKKKIISGVPAEQIGKKDLSISVRHFPGYSFVLALSGGFHRLKTGKAHVIYYNIIILFT
jgi:hypothetical protein